MLNIQLSFDKALAIFNKMIKFLLRMIFPSHDVREALANQKIYKNVLILSNILTCSSSFSISVALMTRGPLTAYSMVLMQGLMLLMVRVWSHCCCSILTEVVAMLRLKTTLDKGVLRGLRME